MTQSPTLADIRSFLIRVLTVARTEIAALAALFVVADRLHQTEGDWRPFHAPAWLRSVYPRPESWQHLHPQMLDIRAGLPDHVMPMNTMEPDDPMERLRVIATHQRGAD